MDNKNWDLVDTLISALGVQMVLDEVLMALDTDTFEDIVGYVAQNYGIENTRG